MEGGTRQTNEVINNSSEINNFKELQAEISTKLTPELFEKILKKKSKCKKVEITKIEFGKAAKKGDSYLSHVTRFSVQYKCISNVSGNASDEDEVKLHIIAKSLIRNIARRKTFRCPDFFENEFTFYTKVWPEMDAFQKEMNVKDVFTEIPNCLHAYIDGENDFILLEDLSSQGYEELDRSKELNLDMMKIVLQIFARFHGLGFAFKLLKSDTFAKVAFQLEETYFQEKYRSWYDNFLRLLENVAMDSVKKHLPMSHVGILGEVIRRDIYTFASRSCLRRSKLATITHGDAWLPNIMMRFEAESINPEHSVIIDFQLTRYASMALDLHMLFYVCTGVETREHYDDLLRFYCDEFNKFVAQFFIGRRQPLKMTYEYLVDELKADGRLGLCMCMEGVIMALAEDKDINDEDLEGDEAVPLTKVWRLKPFSSEWKTIKVAQFIQHMIDRRYIWNF